MNYITATGRRKAAIARIYLSKGKGKITVNDREYKEYFPIEMLFKKLERPFQVAGVEGKFDVKINVLGGGIKGQAEAISLGISRALIQVDEKMRPALKEEKLLTRDPRVVERKKFGKKKARKSFQFSKR